MVRNWVNVLQLVVQHLLEISGTHDEMWGVVDEEKYDKKVDYMLKLIMEGHVFRKEHWGGGDADDQLYVHSECDKTKKHKGKAVCKSSEAPAVKQRRLSGYFKRCNYVDPVRFTALEVRVRGLETELSRLTKLCAKQGRLLENWKSIRKGKSGTKRRLSMRTAEKKNGAYEGRREGGQWGCECRLEWG